MCTWGVVLWVVVQDILMVYEQEEVANAIVMRHGLMEKKLIPLNPQIETDKPQIWQLVSSITICVGKHGICMNTTKVDSIQKWLIPTIIVEVQQFVGFAQYYSLAPLTNQIKAKTSFKWTKIEQDAFEKLKQSNFSKLV